jgi:hypothetical protein
MNLLHLSDLHFGTFQQASIWSAQLLLDLKNELNIFNIEALILSGDIANKSTESEYEAALRFIKELRKDFNLKPSQIIIVPGNHDLNWQLSEKAYKPVSIYDLKAPPMVDNCLNLTDSNHVIVRRDDHIEQRDDALSRDRFRYFGQFYHKVKKKIYPISDYAKNYTIDYLPGNDDQALLILGLNSAWEIDHHHKDSASINMEALSNALKEIDRNLDYRDCRKIAVWHHPLDSAGDDRIKDRSFLDQLVVSGFCLFMHGHVHKAETSRHPYDMSPNGRGLYRICAGTFGASTRELTSGYPWQYNLLQFDGDQLIVTTRRREEEEGAWKPDARWSQGAGKDPLPRYTIHLRKKEAVVISKDIALNNDHPDTRQITYFSQFDAAWVGRNDLISQILEKLNGSCRLLILEGITGIGKTALAECLANKLYVNHLDKNLKSFFIDRFDVDTKSTDFILAGTRWLEEWGETIPEKQNDVIMPRVLKKLKSTPCLIILDSFEFILEGNEDDGWGKFKDEEWVTFFERYLDGDCASKIIITTQESPKQINYKYKDTLWHAHVLKGLSASEQIDLFEILGLEVHGNNINRAYLLRIGSIYEGHPLALKIIVGEIREARYKGNLVTYWKEHGKEIEQVEKAIKEANDKGLVESKDDKWRLENYSKSLRERVKKRLDISLERLKNESYNAYYLLCSSSLYRIAVKKKWWLDHLDDLNCEQDEKELAFDILEDHFLIEWEDGSAQVRLHNLIRSLALKHLEELEAGENA